MMRAVLAISDSRLEVWEVGWWGEALATMADLIVGFTSWYCISREKIGWNGKFAFR